MVLKKREFTAILVLSWEGGAYSWEGANLIFERFLSPGGFIREGANSKEGASLKKIRYLETKENTVAAGIAPRNRTSLV